MSQSFDFDSSKQWAILAFDYLCPLSLSLSLYLYRLSGYFEFRQCCLKLSSEALDYTLLESSMESFDCAFSIQAASHSTVLSQYKQGVVRLYFLNKQGAIWHAFTFRAAFSIFKQWAIWLCFSLLAASMLSQISREPFGYALSFHRESFDYAR